MASNTLHKRILVGAVAVMAAAAVALVAHLFADGDDHAIMGEIEVTEYRVSSKVSGTVLELFVREGDYVRIGDTLAIYSTTDPIITKPIDTTSSVDDALYKQAKEAFEAAKRSYVHIEKLYEEGAVTEETRIEALTNYKLMEAQLAAAAGNMHTNELVQRSLVEGEVHEVYLPSRSTVTRGTPVMSIDILKEVWGTFMVDEEQLGGMAVGDVFTAHVPAFNKNIAMKVYYIRKVGSTQPDSADEGSESRLRYEIKARPIDKMEGLRPDMTLVIKN